MNTQDRQLLSYKAFSNFSILQKMQADEMQENALRFLPFAVKTNQGDESQEGMEPEYEAPIVIDGVTEWAEYRPTREKIEGLKNHERELNKPKPIRTISIGTDLPSEFARRIRVPELTQVPEVSIIIPVFNQIELTLECLASIALNSGKTVSYEVLVSDDASTDDTRRILESMPCVVYLRNEENLGLLRNCNKALNSARGKYVVFLNNDTQVMPKWLYHLRQTFDQYPKVGAVGPKFVYDNGYLQEAGVAFRYDGLGDMIGLNENPDLPRYNYTRRVDYVSGACLMAPTELLRKLGGFSEEFLPRYFEDTDLCLQIRKEGYEIYYQHNAVVVHHLSKTTEGADDNFKTRSIAENLVKLKKKWADELEQISQVRCIVFYESGYYSNAWPSGVGYMESENPWFAVKATEPQFDGHQQPKVPTDMGYYSQLMPQNLRNHAALARTYGIGGFCFNSYWVKKQELWEHPLSQMLTEDSPQIPYCICMSDGDYYLDQSADEDEEDGTLVAEYSTEGLIKHFVHSRYICVENRPLILIRTKKSNLPVAVSDCRKVCERHGIPNPYIVWVTNARQDEIMALNLSETGCEGVLIEANVYGFFPNDYRDFAVQTATSKLPPYTSFPCAIPCWDDTPMMEDVSRVLNNCSPGAFQAWLEEIMDQTRRQNYGEERMVFIHSWNDWLHGAFLEPDKQFEYSRLEAIRNAVDSAAFSSRNKRHLIH